MGEAFSAPESLPEEQTGELAALRPGPAFTHVLAGQQGFPGLDVTVTVRPQVSSGSE